MIIILKGYLYNLYKDYLRRTISKVYFFISYIKKKIIVYLTLYLILISTLIILIN